MKKIKNKKTGEIRIVEDSELSEYGLGGTIHIKKKNVGKFNATKKATGKTTEEALHSKDPHVRQMANFARNSAKWNKKDIGGFTSQDPEFRIGDEGFTEIPYTPTYNPNEFNPSLTYGLEQYNKSKGYNFGKPDLTQTEQGQYDAYKQQQQNPWQNVGQQFTPSMDNLQNLPLATIPNITNSKWWAKADKHLQAGQQKAVKAGQELVSGFTGGAGGGGAGDMMKMFSKKHGGYIPKMTGGGMMNWLNAASYGLGATADFAAMGMDTTGALLDTFGTMNVNNQIEQWKNDNKKQFAFNKAENLPPIEQYGYQFQGRNNALYETGGSIKEIGGQGFPNVEIEGGENVDLPDGYSEQVNGLSHAEGGIKLNLPEGTKVYSKKLIHPETGKSYAKMAKKLETKKDFEHKESKYSDKMNQATADLNISLKDTEKDKLFLDQEIRKIDGEFGKKVKESTLNDYKMKFGGLKKFDGKSGKNIVDNNPPLAGTKGIGESNFSGDLDSLYNYLKQNGYNGNNEIGNMQSFYISQDPDLVANYMLGVRPNNKAIEIWNKKYALDGQKAKSYKDVNMSLMSKEDRIAAFKDYKWDYRAPKFKQKVVETPVVTKPGLKSDTPSKIESIKGGFDSGNLKFQKPNITALAFDNYLRDPITSYPLDPQYVNPRYLDINPELNDINRDIATGLSYVTDRTGNSIANVANILNQARAGKQKTYGSKYQYDRQQDQWAEGTNAQTKMNIDTQNLNNYITNVRNPILQREATITEQQQLNNNAQLKEQAEREHEQAVKDYLSEVYNPNYALNENFSNPYNLKSYKVESEEAKKAKAIETLLGTNKKFGGKVKIKAKKKK